MHRAPSTRKDIAAVLDRLNAVYQRHDAATLTAMGYGWHDALGDLDAQQLDGAAGLAIRDEQRFPTPAKLREYARTWREGNRVSVARVERDTDATAALCRYCGSRPRLAWIAGTERDGTPNELRRFIAPFDPHQAHPYGLIPYPETFLRWADVEDTA